MMQTNRTQGLVRMGLMGAAFFALTIILVVFQPGSPRQATNEISPDASVTRVAPVLENTSVLSEETSDANVITQSQPNSVFEGQSTASAQTGAPATVRDMTFFAISNLKSVTTGEAPAPGEPGSLLHSVVQRSLGANPVQIDPQPEPETVSVQPVRRPATGRYFVRSGDTLVSIAQDIYGDANMASELFLNNTDIISRPDNLSVGMILALP